MTLSDYLGDYKDHGEKGFLERHGDGFLIYQGLKEDFKQPDRPWRQTMGAGDRRVGHTLISLDEVKVLQLRYTGRSTSPLFITVGRGATSNDVVLSDESISSFHAFFQRGSTGEFLLLDANSTNGTYLNDRPVSSTSGAPVKSGDKIRFGSVLLTFVDARGLIDYGTKLGLIR